MVQFHDNEDPNTIISPSKSSSSPSKRGSSSTKINPPQSPPPPPTPLPSEIEELHTTTSPNNNNNNSSSNSNKNNFALHHRGVGGHLSNSSSSVNPGPNVDSLTRDDIDDAIDDDEHNDDDDDNDQDEAKKNKRRRVRIDIKRRFVDLVSGHISKMKAFCLNGKERIRSKLENLSSWEGSSTTTTRRRTRRRGMIIIIFLIALILLLTQTHQTKSSSSSSSTTQQQNTKSLRQSINNLLLSFLSWIKSHPIRGSVAYIIVYWLTVVLLVPGTPLTIGGGYVFRMLYGWKMGVLVASSISWFGSLLGSVSCFVLGRYLMRERVRRWVRNYPMFDAIDMAVTDNGFRLMCLIYLTPILPLGPASYMIGTTSMNILSFAAAKIAAFPHFVVYVFIGASAGSLVGGKGLEEVIQGGGGGGGAEQGYMAIGGLILSVGTMGCISHVVKKELNKIIDKQKENKERAVEQPISTNDGTSPEGGHDGIELGHGHHKARHRKH